MARRGAGRAVTGDRLDGGLAEAIRATVRLPEHLADPRLAWRQPVDQRALPGPIVYWAATLVVIAAVAIVAVVVLRLWRSSRDRGRVRLGVETRARFATTRDLAPLVVQRPVPSGRFVLGRVHRPTGRHRGPPSRRGRHAGDASAARASGRVTGGRSR